MCENCSRGLPWRWGVELWWGGGRRVEQILYRPNFSIKIFIAKNFRVNLGGVVRSFTTPQQYDRVKNFLYNLTYVSKVYIPNLRPLVPPLHLNKHKICAQVRKIQMFKFFLFSIFKKMVKFIKSDQSYHFYRSL